MKQNPTSDFQRCTIVRVPAFQLNNNSIRFLISASPALGISTVSKPKSKFVLIRFVMSVAYSEVCQKSRMDHFAKIVHG